MATVEERLARIEGAYEHLATKADVVNLKVWMIGTMLATLGAGRGLAKLIF